jgi:hypothetical protein
MKCGELNHHASLPDLSGHKRNCLCQQKIHLICYISDKFLRIPPCRDVFYVKFSVKNTASYIYQGYSNSETHFSAHTQVF